MSAAPAVNRRIVLARRPQGEPQLQDFRLERVALPAAGAGQLLLRTRYLSLDPYMRGRMNAGRSYVPRGRGGAVMVGPDGERGGDLGRSGLQGGGARAGSSRLAGLRGVGRPRSRAHRPRARTLRPMRSACSACPDSPPTWGCSTSGSRRPGRPWWSPRPPVPSGRWSDRSPRSRAAAWWASPAVRDKCDYALTHPGASMPASIIEQPNLPERLARRAPRGSTCTSRTSAARSSRRCCRC